MDSAVIAIIITLIFSALFSGLEIAFISADKLHLELSKKKGEISGRLLSFFVKKPSWFISTTLIGNNIALVVYGIFFAMLVEPFIAAYLPESELLVFVIQSSLATMLVLITAEFLPKSLSMINPNGFLTFFAIPLRVFFFLLYPVVWMLVKLSRFLIINVMRMPYSEKSPVYGLTDLSAFVQRTFSDENSNTEQKPEIDTKIFSNALEFKKIKVRDCMVPRTDVQAVDTEDSIQELINEFIETGHSKILVYKGTIDNIIGYCNSLDMFKKPDKIETILQPILIVPETLPARELMVRFTEEKKNIALVVDEYGGTSGIITMEDIVEEIFGEIIDEYDESDLTEKTINNNTYIMSARHEIDYLNEKYGWNLPEGEYETLGGLIFSIVEDFPKVGEHINIKNYSFTILSVDGNKLVDIKISLDLYSDTD